MWLNGRPSALLGQAANWLVAPTELSFTPGGVNVNSATLGGGNSLYDDNGNLVFVVNGNAIVNAQGAFLGVISPNIFPNLGKLSPEVAICQVPGNCSQYYVMLGETQPFFSVDLHHVKVDISTNPISVIPVATSPLNLNDHDIVMAVSGEVVNFPGERWLYTLTDGGDLDRFQIKNNGIFFEANIFTNGVLPPPYSTVGSNSTEGEVLGNCFAWGDAYSNRAHVAVFDQQSAEFQQLYTLELPEGTYACGVEFDPGVDYLYVSAFGSDGGNENGIYRFDIKAGTPSRTLMQVEGDERYSNTHIEFAIDQHFYMVSETGVLGKLPLGGNTITPLNATSARTIYPGLFFPVFALPDQIDNETFAAEPFATVQSYTINQVPLESASTVVPEFYECNPLTLQATVADATTYSLRIENLPGTPPLLIETNSEPVPGPFITEDLLNISINTNIGTQTGLQNQTGTYRVTLTLNTDCSGSTIREGVFKLEASPDPATAQIAMIRGCQGCSTCYSQDLAAPCVIGVAGGSLEITNVANIDYYRIDELAEIDCATGTVIETLYTETNNSNPPPTTFSINAFNIQLPNSSNIPWTGTGYFFNNAIAVANRCYRLTVVVGNVCGEVSDFTYFQPSGQYRLANPATAVEGAVREATVSLFPNPVASNAMISYELTIPASVEVSFSDLSGQVVARESFPQQTAGTHQQKVNLSSLPSGVYLYQIHMADEVKVGRIVKL
jgi:hypothetical protein